MSRCNNGQSAGGIDYPLNRENVEEKIIKGLLVRRSSLYPNYGCSVSGKVFRWDKESEMSVWLSGNPRISEEGHHDMYMVFRTCHNNKTGFGYLHKILGDCWVYNDNPELKTQVNHKDGFKENCEVSNLEWVTPSQNQRHALTTGLKQKGHKLYNSYFTDDQVHEICKRLFSGEAAKSIQKDYECSLDSIAKIRTGSCYFHVRSQYNLPITYRSSYTEEQVEWVCQRIVEGYADNPISKLSTFKITPIDVKRIRYKIRYKEISDNYFKSI